MTSPTNRSASAFAVQEAMVKRFTAQHPCASPLVLMCYLPHNRTATVTPRPADSSAPNVSSVGSHPQSPPAPRTQVRGEYAPNSLSSVAQSCRVLANDAACSPPAERRTPLSIAAGLTPRRMELGPARAGRAHPEVLFHPVCLAPSLAVVRTLTNVCHSDTSPESSDQPSAKNKILTPLGERSSAE